MSFGFCIVGHGLVVVTSTMRAVPVGSQDISGQSVTAGAGDHLCTIPPAGARYGAYYGVQLVTLNALTNSQVACQAQQGEFALLTGCAGCGH
ncbi:hypothetical protein KJ782_06965 [Patescibacteria group bacterium]|nr:hypothetical protein [Patescibacteria group bacterium]